MRGLIAQRLALVALFVGIAGSSQARADCQSDCSTEYESATAACQAADPDPGSPDALQSCMDQAQSQYGACTNACVANQNELDD